MRCFGDPSWLLDGPAGQAWGFGAGWVHWERQAMSSAAALTSGQEAAGAQGFHGSKDEGLPDEGLGGSLGSGRDEEGSLWGSGKGTLHLAAS